MQVRRHNLGKIPSGPVPLRGFMASSNVLAPASDAVIIGYSLHGLRFKALLVSPSVIIDENCLQRMSALAWL